MQRKAFHQIVRFLSDNALQQTALWVKEVLYKITPDLPSTDFFLDPKLKNASVKNITQIQWQHWNGFQNCFLSLHNCIDSEGD